MFCLTNPPSSLRCFFESFLESFVGDAPTPRCHHGVTQCVWSVHSPRAVQPPGRQQFEGEALEKGLIMYVDLSFIN